MINILFCGNDKVFDGMLCCALSILKRTQTSEPFSFYIFTMDVSHIKESYLPLSDAQADFFRGVVKQYNGQNEVIKIDVGDIYKREFSACPNEDAYCSPYTLIRLFADLADLPSRVLYLDVDVMFNRDIRLLYDTDIEGYEYAAARDHYGKYLVHPNYINAGVLLFNMDEMKRTGIFVRARELIKKKKLTFADQSALLRSTTKKENAPTALQRSEIFAQAHCCAAFFKEAVLASLPSYRQHKAMARQPCTQGIFLLLL